MKRIVLIICFCFCAVLVRAQDCGCDHVIPADMTTFDGAAVAPGDVVCIEAGIRSHVAFENMHGTAANPVVVQNCGGDVVINAPFSPYGINIRNSTHIQLTGENFGSSAYGIQVINSNGYGIWYNDLSNYCGINQVKIQNTNTQALFVQDDPRCDLTANEGVFYLRDCHFQNMLIENCKQGIEIGHPRYHLGIIDPDCEALFPYSVENLTLENIEIESITEGNAITVYGATDSKISKNKIRDIHGVGVFTGTKSAVIIEQNEIKDTYQCGIKAEGNSQHEINNNLLVNNSGVGQGAVWIEFFAAAGETDQNSVQFAHNTMVNSGSYNLTIDHPENATAPTDILNNIFCEAYEVAPSGETHAPYMSLSDGLPLFTISGNRFSTTRFGLGFVNPGEDDFRLTHESYAINAGVSTALEEDITGQIRNLAGAPDAGAFEYVPEPISYFGQIELVGLYVNDFRDIIGDPVAEEALFDFANENGFNYLLLYNLDYIHHNIAHLDDPEESEVMADFIERAKKERGIVQVGAVGETDASYNKVQAFNAFQGDNWFRKFDVLNLEFEYWANTAGGTFNYYCENYLEPGGYACTNAAAFEFYQSEIEDIDERAHEMGIISEIYLGYPNDAEGTALGERCDRILLHYYRTSDTYGDGSSIYNYYPNRIRAIALSDRKPAVMPIFSSRSYHMGPWLLTHSLHQPMDTWRFGVEGYEEDDSEGVHDLPISGYQWYRYTSFLEPGGDIIEPIAPLPGVFSEEDVELEIIPFSSSLTLSLKTEEESVHASAYQVRDVHGKIMFHQLSADETVSISTDTFAPGIYFFSVMLEDGRFLTKKWVLD